MDSLVAVKEYVTVEEWDKDKGGSLIEASFRYPDCPDYEGNCLIDLETNGKKYTLATAIFMQKQVNYVDEKYYEWMRKLERKLLAASVVAIMSLLGVVILICHEVIGLF